MQQEHEDEELGILVLGYRLYSSVSMSHSVQSITASWCRVKCIVRSVYSAPYPFRILKPHINKKSRNTKILDQRSLAPTPVGQLVLWSVSRSVALSAFHWVGVSGPLQSVR